jgi:hypothetical protein
MHQEPSGVWIMAYTTIDNPFKHFNTLLYTGNGATSSAGSTARTLTGVGFQPDWVWVKERSDTEQHFLQDVVRGASKVLASNGTGAEVDVLTGYTDGGINGFVSDGFTLGSGTGGNANNINTNSETYVAWNWKAGTAFSNDASATGIGSFDSTGSVNTDAGFSVISYTGNGSGGATVAHGLGSVPHMYIIKRRDTGSSNWHVYHQGIGATKGLRLNLSNAENTTDIWQDTAPTSSVFSLGSSVDVNASGGTFIGYIFSEKQGYSKFGSFTGNGSSDGSYIHLGFKPAWVMIKRTGGVQDWIILDNKRPEYNETNRALYANANYDDTGTDKGIDILSNGFKLRKNHAAINYSENYIYMAFAESPFVTAGTKAAGTAR